MAQKILNFIKYNNAFTIIFVIVFLSFGVTFAASEKVREGVYSSEERIISIDNSLILSTDLNSFDFNLKINSVTEDEKNYYAIYSYQTMAIIDNVWQAKQVEKTLAVSRVALDGKDLGLYVARELGENINYELSSLKRVQKMEREKGASQKIVAIDYSGLIGKFIDPEQKVIEGYNPIIPEITPEVAATVEFTPDEVIVSVSRPKLIDKTQKNDEQATGSDSSGIKNISPVITASTSPNEDISEPIDPPTPEEMIDEELVQEVVEQLLEDEQDSVDSQPLEEDTSVENQEPSQPLEEDTSVENQEPSQPLEEDTSVENQEPLQSTQEGLPKPSGGE